MAGDRDAPSRATLEHYESSAEQFWQGTRDHDVSQNIESLLEALEGEGPFSILDFGCGPGRDLMAIKARGHRPTGLDGSASFVRMAREHADVPVLHQNFLALDLPADRFDGIFANASLFHVPKAELPRVLRELGRCLRPRGVLFSSNPRGNNEEGWSRGRFGAYHDFDAWSGFVTGAGFEPIRHYYRPDGLPRDQQPWLASLWRRAESRGVTDGAIDPKFISGTRHRLSAPETRRWWPWTRPVEGVQARRLRLTVWSPFAPASAARMAKPTGPRAGTPADPGTRA